MNRYITLHRYKTNKDNFGQFLKNILLAIKSHLPSQQDNNKNALIEEFITSLKNQIASLKNEINSFRVELKEKNEIIKRCVSQIIRKVNQNLLKEIENSVVKDMSSSTLHHKLKKQC